MKKDLKKAVMQADSMFNEGGDYLSVTKMRKSAANGGSKQ